MAVKQNTTGFSLEFPTAAKAVNESFYVDDGLTGVDSIDEAIALQRQLQELFAVYAKTTGSLYIVRTI